MSDVGTAVNRQPNDPALGALPSVYGQLPKTVAFWLIAVIFAALLFSASAPTPLYAVYQAQWHFSSKTLTIIFGIYGVGVLTALVAFGALSDRVGRRPVLAASLIAMIVTSS